ncbi:exosome complex exonuclease RRP45-like protein [Dinothrombium tinctorium]|uniref:Exosome complex component RRP45 n=1 Tax=Dinothrombium tinctorium TaxID=1965070 RepID=A0A443QVH9_9ACAR|nr:exosome complex exonuclease RRP45-like protein [Dinothrombium tinctorium]
MFQIPLCNRKHILKSIAENKRIDGRQRDEFREVDIDFGLEYGSCVVRLGNTKVISSVVWEIVEPRPTKPCEGLLQISVDLSPMSSPYYDVGKMNDKFVEILRIIEKSIRDSKCIDLESLCLIAREKVWSLKVEIIVLNDEGNLIECCSIAAIVSLSHCVRADVTVSEDKVTVHSFEEKHPLPLRIFHYPFCTTYALFNSSNVVIADPLELEELCCEGFLTVSANNFREITTLHISGKSRVSKEKILQCCNATIQRAKLLTQYIQNCLKEDANQRNSSSKALSIGEGGSIAWDVDVEEVEEPHESEKEDNCVKIIDRNNESEIVLDSSSDEEVMELNPTEFAAV